MCRYRGRFAPSPTGPLHFGSLFAAVISYLDARYHLGDWLLRIEDIDPPREHPKAKQLILKSLQAHGLQWDGPVTYQSDRSELYQAILSSLDQKGHCYRCPCSRKHLARHHGVHLPSCTLQTEHKLACAYKFRAKGKSYTWNDGIQGILSSSIEDDFVLKRKEQLYSYQLAVVADDIAQEITHVVRGSDLLDSTPMQLALYEGLDLTPPTFCHFPVIVNRQKQKLSKQNLAPAIDDIKALDNLLTVFQLAGLPISTKPKTVRAALEMALDHWHLKRVPRVKTIETNETLNKER